MSQQSYQNSLIKGVVVSDRMSKTRVVQVERLVRHPNYNKFITRHKKFYVHDENNTSLLGDTIAFYETRPLSKLKRYMLDKVVATGIRAPELGKDDSEVLKS